SFVHGAGDRGNGFKILEYPGFSVEVVLKYLPVIDAGLSRSAGISQHKAPIQLFRRNRDRLTMDAINVEADRVYAAIERWIIILASGRHLDQLRFYVLRDHPDFFTVKLAPGKASQRGGSGNHQC